MTAEEAASHRASLLEQFVETSGRIALALEARNILDKARNDLDRERLIFDREREEAIRNLEALKYNLEEEKHHTFQEMSAAQTRLIETQEEQVRLQVLRDQTGDKLATAHLEEIKRRRDIEG